MKHILIIPSEHYVTKEMPLAGLFQFHHAELLKEFGYKVGIISAGFVPFSKNLKPYNYKRFEKQSGNAIYRDYFRVFIPGRIALRFLQGLLISRYTSLFKKYIINEGMPDVIHAHNCLFAGAVALRIKQKYGIPFVITEHSSLFQRGLVSQRQIALSKEVFKNADAKTTVSTTLGNALVSIIGPSVNPFIPIYNVLENTFSVDFVCDDKKKQFTFLSIGSLDSNKNHLLLLKSFSSCFKGNLYFRLQIGGTGELRSELEYAAKDLGVFDQVDFLGYLARSEVVSAMSKCDVFVLSSNVETFGVVLIEALRLGKPVISTNCGGPSDIVNELNGLLIPVGNDESLSNAMCQLYKDINRYDPKTIQQDCEDRFGREAFHQRLEKIYSEILK